MRSINILHLSDIHICEDNLINVEQITKCIIEDLRDYQSSDYNIDFVCFSGDLISSGKMDEYTKAKELFIDPILDSLNLDSSSFYTCQGNHENNLELHDEIIHTGLNTKIKSLSELDTLWSSKRIYQYLNNNVHNFNTFIKGLNNKIVFSSDLTYYSELNIDDYLIGLAVFNSSWNSAGNSENDYGNLIIGSFEIDAVISKLSKSALKIAMFHHPLEYLYELDRIQCERILNNFDIILTGHLHSPQSFQKFSQIYNTLHLSAGRLDQFDMEHNGFSIINVNPYTKEVKVIFRKYYGKRKCFDKSLNDAPEGIYNYNLTSDNQTLKMAYNYANSMKDCYSEVLKERLIFNAFQDTPKTINIIKPNIKSYSDYDNLLDTEKKAQINICDILQSDESYSLFGKRDYGKSTTLKYMAYICCVEFETIQRYPFLLDMNSIDYSGKNQLKRAIKKSFSKLSENNISIKDNDLSDLLSSNNAILLIDNFDVQQKLHIQTLLELLNEYPKLKCMITQMEDVLDCFNFENNFTNFQHFNKIYLHPTNKVCVFNFASSFMGKDDDTIYCLVDKTEQALFNLGMSKTPFNAVLLLSVYNNDNDFTSISEANVVERFMEMLLEKIDVSENNISSFDFKNKEDFLINLTEFMLKNNTFTIYKSDFDALLKNFFIPYGLDYESSLFNTLFFSKKVLNLINDQVSFSHKFILEYYIAKSFFKNGIPKNAIEDYGYLNYINEFNYYSGICRNINEVFEIVENDFIAFIEKYQQLNLCDYDFDIDINLDFDFVIPPKKISNQEKNELTNLPDISNNYMPAEYSKNKPLFPTSESKNQDLDKFSSTFNLYSRLIRNMDYLDLDHKKKAINYCISACCIMLSIFKQHIISSLSNDMTELKSQVLEECPDGDPEKIIKDFTDVIKLSMPTIIETTLFQWIGNAKLLPIFQLINSENTFSGISQFIFSSLFLDLHGKESYELINKMIKLTDKKTLLQIIYLKLMNTYLMTNSDFESNKLLNLIYEIIHKQNPTKMKRNKIQITNKQEVLNQLQEQKRKYNNAI